MSWHPACQADCVDSQIARMLAQVYSRVKILNFFTLHPVKDSSSRGRQTFCSPPWGTPCVSGAASPFPVDLFWEDSCPGGTQTKRTGPCRDNKGAHERLPCSRTCKKRDCPMVSSMQAVPVACFGGRARGMRSAERAFAPCLLPVPCP